RLGTPTDLAGPATWQHATVSRYGRTDPVLLAEITCLWYGSYRSRTVRVVLVREPGAHPKAGYHLALITTDLHTPAAHILAPRPAPAANTVPACAPGWPMGAPLQTAKRTPGAGEADTQTATAVARTVPFGLITQSIVVLWYTHHGHTPQITEDRRAQALWYRT